MRSTNKRSRSKSNRPKTLGNIVNRVFDSSGPEGKVRGTPQQIIEKYQVLARDAQLSNDRVAAENFQQHAEHYTRLLAQAMREQQAEQEARRNQQEERNRSGGEDRGDRGQQGPRRNEHRRHHMDGPQNGDDLRDQVSSDSFAVQESESSQADHGSLVETPEAAASESAPSAAPMRDDRAPSTEHKAFDPAQADAGSEKPAPRRQPRARKAAASEDDASASKPASKPRNTRKPRKPAAEKTQTEKSPSEQAAAE